jgi:hypothetical protein
VIDAMEITISRFSPKSNADPDAVIRYFCGICWRKIKADQRKDIQRIKEE